MMAAPNTNPRTGADCEHPRVERVARAGRGRPYLQFEFLEIPAELELPTCPDCNDVLAASDRDAEVIDTALDDAWRARVTAIAKRSLDSLVRAGVRQRDLERVLGLSAGYLSKVKTSKDPSSMLVAALALLSNEPRLRFGELQSVWNHPDESVGSATIEVVSSEIAPIAKIIPFPTKSSGSAVTTRAGVPSP